MLLDLGKKRAFGVCCLGVAALAVVIATAVALPNGRLRWQYELEDLFHDGGFGLDESAKLCELVQKELADLDPRRKWPEPTMDGTTLIVETTLAGHSRVEDLLGQLRRAKGSMVTVEPGTFDPRSFLEEIGITPGAPTVRFLPNNIQDIDEPESIANPRREIFSSL